MLNVSSISSYFNELYTDAQPIIAPRTYDAEKGLRNVWVFCGDGLTDEVVDVRPYIPLKEPRNGCMCRYWCYRCMCSIIGKTLPEECVCLPRLQAHFSIWNNSLNIQKQYPLFIDYHYSLIIDSVYTQELKIFSTNFCK